MAQLTVQEAGFDGLADTTFVAATAGGDQFTNTGREVLQVVNGSMATIVVTINSQALCSQGFDHDIDVTVLAGDTATIGTFPPARFNDGSNNVLITYDDVTTVTVAVVKI